MLASLCACAGLRPRPTEPDFRLLSPAAAGFALSMTQELSVVRGGDRLDAMAAVEISSSAVTLAGLGPFGNRLLTLSWDGSRLTKEIDPSLPKAFPVESALRDVQLVYWPEDAVRRGLPPGWTLTSGAGRRDLLRGGEEVEAVRYSGDRFKDPVEVDHEAAGYKIEIRTLESAHE